MAADNGEEIRNATALDVSRRPHFSSNLDESDYVKDGHEVGQGTEKARVAHCLRVLAEGVARDEVGDQAQADVVEAAA